MSLTKAAEGLERQRTLSLSARLTLWYFLSAFAVVLAVTGYFYWMLVRNLEEAHEQFLADQVTIMRVLLRDRPDDSAAIRQEVEWESNVREHARIYLRILDGLGNLVMESPGMQPHLGPDLFPPPVEAQRHPGPGVTVRASDGRAFCLVAAEVGTTSPERRTIQAALDVTSEEKVLAGIRRGMFPALLVFLIACAWIGYRIARRGIRPVEEMALAARRIRSSTLSERLPMRGLPTELWTLAVTFNEMLTRLEESFVRLERFSADLAHELRTPINNLRGEVEVALGKSRSPEEYREILSSCLEECARLSRMIESLLFLARAEDPRAEIQREPLDVGSELVSVREFYGAAAEETGVVLTVRVDSEIKAKLDRPLFQRAVSNLVENALAYTPPGGEVVLGAARDDGYVRVEVRDTGRGIAAEHLPRLFDRFYRVDRSRTSSTGGMGLGLAIVKGIADLHGGSVRIESEPGRGTSVVLLFPDKS